METQALPPTTTDVFQRESGSPASQALSLKLFQSLWRPCTPNHIPTGRKQANRCRIQYRRPPLHNTALRRPKKSQSPTRAPSISTRTTPSIPRFLKSWVSKFRRLQRRTLQTLPNHTRTPLICDLANFPMLEHLSFHFHILPPKQIDNEVVYSRDPWLRADPERTEVSCQKAFVNVFLTLALEHIRHIPKITLSGHVKDSTRRKWESILRDEKMGVRHDISGRLARLRDIPYKYLSVILCGWSGGI
jgi:hypothetical protein